MRRPVQDSVPVGNITANVLSDRPAHFIADIQQLHTLLYSFLSLCMHDTRNNRFLPPSSGWIF
jgi:hypothetical protein